MGWVADLVGVAASEPGREAIRHAADGTAGSAAQIALALGIAVLGATAGAVVMHRYDADVRAAARDATTLAAREALRADSLQVAVHFGAQEAHDQRAVAQHWQTAAANAQAQSAACNTALRSWWWQEVQHLEAERASATQQADALLQPGFYGNPAGGVAFANQLRAAEWRFYGAAVAAQITTLSARPPA